MNALLESIRQILLPGVKIASLDPHNPVIVHYVPSPWQVLGTGNYAAVFYHPDFPDQVVKIYAPGRPGHQEEIQVYRRLGSHPAFSQLLYTGDEFLVLKRLHGITLYDAMHLGIPIPKQVIQDIDEALRYARQRGLFPHDVHGRNVMMQDGRGLVVDVSDFLHQETCSAWKDLKTAYYWLYRPFLSPLRVRVPYFMLDLVRLVYRLWRRFTNAWGHFLLKGR
ncbi:serine/threonine protein kinase [Leptodesmis sp.]|uniref:serine/threonine protein kinase n=1 Tax=Leptodesmis sp. TaxID=3100501 RepID=UPI004053519C